MWDFEVCARRSSSRKHAELPGAVAATTVSMLQRCSLAFVVVSALVFEIAACAPMSVHAKVAEPPALATTDGVPLPFALVFTFKAPDSVQSFMRDHYRIVAWARDDVIVGDTKELQVPLRQLADYRSDARELEQWKPWLSRLQSAASMTAQATTIELAAAGVATMARTCGECHRSTHRGPPASRASEPDKLTSNPIANRMHVHSWATERLWAGLTEPSDEAWLAGASALARLSEYAAGDPRPDYAAEFSRIRALGTSALSLTESEQRADVCGVLLATCGHCHVKANVHAVRKLQQTGNIKH